MSLNETTYGNNSKTLERGLVDPIYNLSDPSFAQKLSFQPHKPDAGVLEKCKKIPRFHGFKTLSQTDMKERKRAQVPTWEFQDRKHPFGGGTEAVPVPIYKGSILEKRQKPLTGKDTFDGKLSAEEDHLMAGWHWYADVGGGTSRLTAHSIRDIHPVGGT